MRFLTSLKGHVFELLIGLGVVGVGVYLTVSPGGRPFDAAVGTALTVLGGVLCSWVASRAFAAEESKDEHRESLGTLSRALGQAAGQISRVVEQAQDGQIAPNTAYALVAQNTRMIYGQVNEIAVMRGEEFNPAYIIDTATRLDELARQLESRTNSTNSTADDDLEILRQQITSLRTALSHRGGVERILRTETVVCPYCGHENSAKLGNMPGDTAVVTCDECGHSFNSHRRSTGEAFSRPMGAISITQPTRVWAVPCPECNSELRVKNGGQRKIVCLSCLTGFVANADSETIEVLGKYDKISAKMIKKSGNRPMLECPMCGNNRPHNTPLFLASVFYAFCHEHHKILQMKENDFQDHLPEA